VLAAALACLVAVSIPALLYMVRHSAAEADLRSEAERGARIVSHYIYGNPELWRFESLRLQELLRQVHLPQDPVRRRILDSDGAQILSTEEVMEAPTLVRSAPIFDVDREAGALELTRSLRPLLMQAGLDSLYSLLLGLAIFVIVRVIPVRALRVTFGRLDRAQESLVEALRTAEAANKAKAEFLASMSHELRTPLNAIIGFSDMMASQMLGPIGTPRYLEYSRNIKASGQHLLTIINDVLDYSKAAAGKLNLADEPVDLHATVESAITFVMPQAMSGDVAVVNHVGTDLPHLCGDPRFLRQAIVNLLSNAVKFSPDGTVGIEGFCDPSGDLVIEVRDTGVGIAAEDIPRVLKPFEQSDTAYSRSGGGTGLGLPLVKHIIEAHQGSLTITSELGVGTSIAIRFPAHRLIAGKATGGIGESCGSAAGNVDSRGETPLTAAECAQAGVSSPAPTDVDPTSSRGATRRPLESLESTPGLADRA